MKIAFISNFYNHHQMPLCDGFLALPDVEFTFIATEKVPLERIQLGYHHNFDHLSHYREAIEPEDIATAEQICFDSDVVIIGSAPMKFIQRRLRAKKLTFTYNERWFREGFWRHPGDIYRAFFAYTKPGNRNYYQLCASAYTAKDSNRVLAFPGRKFRWGYFPAVIENDISSVMAKKEPGTLLWVARFLGCKHPEKAIEVANRLKKEGISFRLDMIGIGEKEEEIRALIQTYHLEDFVFLLGSMSPEKVREHMERAQVFLFTSDFGEGWGAVLNEAMNSGCAAVASHAIGSVPYLIDHGKNGLIYENDNFEQLYENVKCLLQEPLYARSLGEEAYKTMVDCWNGQVAAKRLYEFAKAKLAGAPLPVYGTGPMSREGRKGNKHG